MLNAAESGWNGNTTANNYQIAVQKYTNTRRAMDMGVTKSANLKFQHFAENNCL